MWKAVLGWGGWPGGFAPPDPRGIFSQARHHSSALTIIAMVARKPAPQITDRHGDQPKA